MDFPYDLAGLREGIEGITLRDTETIGSGNTHRLTGTPTKKLEEMIGFNEDVSWWRVGVLEVEIWVSRDTLLPLRIEFRSDEFVVFSAAYSVFGTAGEIHSPKEVLDEGYEHRLWSGNLNPEDVGPLVRALPKELQKCVEAQIGTDLYQEGIAGGSDADIIVPLALAPCLWPVNSDTDIIFRGVATQFDELDLTVLTVLPEDMVAEVVECLKASIGLEELFEIGWKERGPTPEELEAAEGCKALAGEG